MRCIVAFYVSLFLCTALLAGQRTPELDVVGTTTFNSDPGTGGNLKTLTINVSEVRNNRATGTSGPLKLQMISTPQKIGSISDGEALAGTVAFSADIGTLQAGFSQLSIVVTGPFNPPQGENFVTFALVETTGAGDVLWDGQADVFRTIVEGTSLKFAVPQPVVLAPATFFGRVGAPLSLVFQAENISNGYVATATGLPKGVELSRDTVDTSGSKVADPFVISGTPTKAGTYSVAIAVTGPEGINGTATTTLQISDKKTNAAPNVLDLQTLPDRTDAGNRITFVGDAEDPENSVLSYSWDFGDGATAQGQQAFHTYSNPGTYTVTLTAADGALQSTRSTTVTITGTPSLRPVIDFASATPNPPAPGTSVTFSAIASDPQNETLTLRWNFGDGSAPVTGNPVTHTYATAGDFAISVTATNTSGLSTTFGELTVFVRNDGAAPNIDIGNARSSAEGLSTDVLPSRGGVIALQLGNAASADTRGPLDFLTVFRIPGRSAKAYKRGEQPVNRFQRSGVALAFSRSTSDDSAAIPTRGRKQLPISSLETGEAGPEDAGPIAVASRSVDVDGVSGKFTFNSDNADSVKLTATFEVFANTDFAKEQEFSAGIGGVIDRVRILDGKAVAKSDRGIIKKVSVKRATDKKSGKTLAKVALELNAPNLDSAGFDTDGVSVASFKKGRTNPTIQVTFVYAGISYKTAEFPVVFSLSTNESGGKINGRAAR